MIPQMPEVPRWLETPSEIQANENQPPIIENELTEIEKPDLSGWSRIFKPWTRPNQVLSTVTHRAFELARGAHRLTTAEIQLLDRDIKLLNTSIEHHNKRWEVKFLSSFLFKWLSPASVHTIDRLFTVESMKVPLSALEERQLHEREQKLNELIAKKAAEAGEGTVEDLLPEFKQLQQRLEWEKTHIQQNKRSHQWSEQPTAQDAFKTMDAAYPEPAKESTKTSRVKTPRVKTPRVWRKQIKEEWSKLLKQQEEERRAYDALGLGPLSPPSIPEAPKIIAKDLATTPRGDFIGIQTVEKMAMLEWLKDSTDPKLAAHYQDLEERINWEESYLKDVTTFTSAANFHRTMEDQYNENFPGKDNLFDNFPTEWNDFKAEFEALFEQQKQERADFDRLNKPSKTPKPLGMVESNQGNVLERARAAVQKGKEKAKKLFRREEAATPTPPTPPMQTARVATSEAATPRPALPPKPMQTARVADPESTPRPKPPLGPKPTHDARGRPLRPPPTSPTPRKRPPPEPPTT